MYGVLVVRSRLLAKWLREWVRDRVRDRVRAGARECNTSFVSLSCLKKCGKHLCLR